MTQCLVKGCTNKSEEGKFSGYLCKPCYNMLTGGYIQPSNAWFVTEMRRLNRKLDDISDILEA